MRIKIRVIPKSSRQEIVEKDGILKVYVKVAPEKGKANKAVQGLIAKKYKVRKSDVTIVAGRIGRDKLVEVSAR
ncbi:MAG: DUF167 domain-containing protein [Candidatus Omnitrophota bacterium]